LAGPVEGAPSPPLPPGWERDSETLYLHADGARIERRVYRKVEGWILVPAELDRAALTFPPDDAGRAAAFAAFAADAAAPPPEAVPREIREARDAARLEESDEDARDEKEDDEDEDEGETT
jgi:hypothetical protein